eukprot:SAG11_NODE_30257_length_302_cov_1.527094_1_plen_80_part_01
MVTIFTIQSELEVLQFHERLGFLSDGSFFGEAAVLADAGSSGLRSRTVRAVVESELCFITREELVMLCTEYAELRARCVI